MTKSRARAHSWAARARAGAIGAWVGLAPWAAAQSPGSGVEGTVEGVFEYSLTVDDVIEEAGETRREHYSQLMGAQLTGHVRDDGRLDHVSYKGTFTQVDRTEGGVGVLSTDSVTTVSGRLVWTREEAEIPHLPTFGDVASTFYVATEGELTVDVQSENRGVAGSSCRTNGRKTFSLASLPESARGYLSLEIAADDRYRMVLAIPDYPDPDVWTIESVCNFPGGQTARQPAEAMRPAVILAVQQGTLDAERSVIGEAAPIRRGPLTTTGDWSFKRIEP